MPRAIILLLDSFGVGALPDAAKFGDMGANTLLHIAEHCAQNRANISNVRQWSLHIPNLNRLGIHLAANNCLSDLSDKNSYEIPGLNYNISPQALYGCAEEMSYGKDTPSGHWEIMGVPVLFDWGYFPPQHPSFPKQLIDEFIKKAELPGILGNCHASGTEIIKKFGDEHVKSGKPICYTSADSVFQIAVHEETFGLERLYAICEIAFELVKPHNIGRIIARPFAGASGKYYRTDHRRDYSVPPPAPTLLDQLVATGGEVIAIGKISDIFAKQGISQKIEAHGNSSIFDAVLEAAKTTEPSHHAKNSLIFANFVDFDMKYGHRRDVAGYAQALEEFDLRLPQLEKILHPDDIVIITADHGCDPTFKGSDHTREYIPILAFGQKIKAQNIGKRTTFADIGQSLATFFALKPLEYGTSFLS